LGAKAIAVMHGKPAPTTNDIRLVAPLVLQHRTILNYAAMADEITPAGVVEELLRKIQEPAYAKR